MEHVWAAGNVTLRFYSPPLKKKNVNFKWKPYIHYRVLINIIPHSYNKCFPFLDFKYSTRLVVTTCSSVIVVSIVSSEAFWLEKQCQALRKKCGYSKFSWSIRTEYSPHSAFRITRTAFGLRISPYSVRTPENSDQNNSKYGQFSKLNHINPFILINPFVPNA